LAEDELAKVLVRREKQGAALIRLPEDRVIYGAGRELRDVEHIVTVRPKPLHYRTVDIFIGDDVHAVFVLIGDTTSARRACAAKRRAASTPSRVKRG
jgi:hypothetical protein